MSKTKWVQVVLKLTSDHARELENAATHAGFPTKTAFLWHLYCSRKEATMLDRVEGEALLQLTVYGNFKGKQTPVLHTFANLCNYPVDVTAKALEGLELKGILKAMPPLEGPFYNDVISNGRRLRVTPYGFDVVKAMGYRS